MRRYARNKSDNATGPLRRLESLLWADTILETGDMADGDAIAECERLRRAVAMAVAGSALGEPREQKC